MEATSILKSLFTKPISNPRHLVLICETKLVHFTLYAAPLSLLIIELHWFISVAALLRTASSPGDGMLYKQRISANGVNSPAGMPPTISDAASYHHKVSVFRNICL